MGGDRAPVHPTAYRKLNRLAKAAAAKAKNVCRGETVMGGVLQGARERGIP